MPRHWLVAAALLAGTVLAPTTAMTSVTADEGTRLIERAATSQPVARPTASVDGLRMHELRSDIEEARSAEVPSSGPPIRNVDFGPAAAIAPAAAQAQLHGGRGTNPTLSVNGLNARDQRLANSGNQFTVEPPDQGLCVGNGFVLETVNTVLRVFDSSGTPLTGVVDLNSFYGYPAEFDRTTGAQGPEITDPSCWFDAPTGRWFHLVLTLEVFPDTGDFTGVNHLDLAVSQTADPRGVWSIYRIPVQDDATQGTPNHGCPPGPTPSGHHPPTNPNACIGDFPHLGADQFGIYLTTNEYCFFCPATQTNPTGFHAAQIYALDKQALANGSSRIGLTQIDTLGLVNGQPGFTVWPATSPTPADYERDARGTEYFTSSNAAEEVSNVPNAHGTNASDQIIVWALMNTSSLRSATPDVRLRTTSVRVDRYTVPPPSNQKAGPVPLADCINDTHLPTPFGPGCWQVLFLAEPKHNEVEGPLDSSDSRVLSTVFADGQLWGTLDTGLTVGGQTKAGVLYYMIRPIVVDLGDRGRFGGDGGFVRAVVERQGHVAVPNNNVIYGALTATHGGQAVMGFTLVGADHYPSAAYLSLGSFFRPGAIHIAAEGLGPQDGFTEYNALSPDGVHRVPRWGDYGAAVADGDTIWLGNEYIGQTCTLAQYYPNPPSLTGFGSCGGTRVTLANWYTRLTAIDANRDEHQDDTPTVTAE